MSSAHNIAARALTHDNEDIDVPIGGKPAGNLSKRMRDKRLQQQSVFLDQNASMPALVGPRGDGSERGGDS